MKSLENAEKVRKKCGGAQEGAEGKHRFESGGEAEKRQEVNQ